MKNSFSLLIFYLLIASNIIFPQNRRGLNNPNVRKAFGGKIHGLVIDSDSKAPIEYSNIILNNKIDSSFYTGTVTNNKGEFTLDKVRPGNYYLDIRFMGFKSERIENLKIDRKNRLLDVGIIELKLKSIKINDVEVVGERSGIEYKIDKKVVNVAKYYTATSGNAVDVLENVPSVNVDIEGNVSLRGSGNFTLLIDNRPTVLDVNDALQQIPASTIEDIEIITNPSAKFDPDGPSGIINLVMKKQGYSGSSGTVNLNFGLDEKYGGDFLINRKMGIITTFLSADYNKRFMPGTSESQNSTIYSDRTSYINSNGNSNRGRTFYGLRGGIDLNFSKENSLGFTLRYGNMDFESSNHLDFESWNSNQSLHDFYNNNSLRSRAGTFLALSADYRHVFGANGHDLTARIFYRSRDMDEKSVTELFNINNKISDGTIITEVGPSSGYRVNIDYKLPISQTNKFELGYQNRLGNSVDNTTNSYFDTITNDYIIDNKFTRNVDYQRYIHSFYSLYSGILGSLGYQGGLRAEYTDRKIELKKTNEKYVIDRWDYFPTLHFSYKLDDANQFIASYTKRIVRPRGWNLEPFETWEDTYNVRKGNPDLQPEDIDSYEAGYQRYFGNNLFSLEAYYRVTNDKIENIRSVYPSPDYDNVILRTVQNVGRDYSFGAELMFDYNITGWWKLNMMGDLFNYKVEGELENQNFTRESTNWRTRFNSTFNISNSTRIQFNNSYNSKTVSSQGTREGYITSSLAIRQQILENLTATLQFRDLFSTAKNEFTSEGPNFYNYKYSTRNAPMVILNLNYNINHYKPNRERNNSGDSNGGENDDL